VHEPVIDPRPVIAARPQILLADALVRERAHRLGVVDAQPVAGLERGRIEAGPGAELRPPERQRPVVIGEPHHHAVLARHPPAAAEGGRAAIEARLQERIDPAHQTRTSMTGIDGISPADRLARLAVIRSVSNRTGTSNSNPAVIAAPAGAGSASITWPVA